MHERLKEKTIVCNPTEQQELFIVQACAIVIALSQIVTVAEKSVTQYFIYRSMERKKNGKIRGRIQAKSHNTTWQCQPVNQVISHYLEYMLKNLWYKISFIKL